MSHHPRPMRRAQKRAAYGLTAVMALLLALDMVAFVSWVAR